jgi:AcrR family transcriptional regulator
VARKRLTRDEQKAQTRARLLAAARKIFARRGYHGASVEDVAEEAGYSTGALYSNFAGKEDLLLALFEDHAATQVRDYNEIFARGETLDEEARGGADRWMAYLREQPDYFPLFIEFWSCAVRDPKLRRRFAPGFGAFRLAMARLIEEGAAERGIELPADFAERFGTVINALGNGIALEKYVDPEAVPDDLFGWALAVIFEALTTGAQSQASEGAA